MFVAAVFDKSSCAVITSLIAISICSGPGCCQFRAAAIDGQIARARELTFHGLNALHHGRSDQAQQLLSQAVKRSPKNERIRQHLATALLDQGQVDQAVEQLQLALEHAPNDPELHVEIGNLYLIKKQPQLALQHAGLALQQNRQLAAAWVLKGRSQRDQDDLSGALVSFHRAANYESEVTDTQLEIASTCRRLGQPMRALTALELFAQQYPPQQIPTEVMRLTGMVLMELNQFERATETLAAATQAADASSEVWIALSRAQLGSGDESNARLTALTAARKFPGDGTIAAWIQDIESQMVQPFQVAQPFQTARQYR